MAKQDKSRIKNRKEWLITVIVIIFLVLIIHTFHIHVFAIQSGSMEPTIKTGSMIITVKNERTVFKEGDVITYINPSDTCVTHRISDVLDRDGVTVYETKGDANEDPDSGLVRYENIVGKEVLSVPFLGYPKTMLNNLLR